MPKNTYKGDIGIKYNFVKDRDGMGGKKTDTMFADETASDEADDNAFDEELAEDTDETGDLEGAGRDAEGFSVLSDSERRYGWEMPFEDGNMDGDIAKKSKKTRKRARNPEPDDDENYDFEIGNNAAGLKILMGLMLIAFIVIISVLIYKLTLLNDDFAALQEKYNAAPTQQELADAKADAATKDLSIKQLNDELSRYRAANATAGELVETPEGSVYVVAQHDTLGQIAEEYDVSINQIMEWNSLDNADSIRIGQRLIVKKAEEGTATEASSTETTTETAN